MTRFGIRSTLSTVLMAATVVAALSGTHIARAAGPEPMAAPAGIDEARPTVSGTLVARPGGKNVPPHCRDQAPAIAARANVARGLVICTEEGNLVLLELTGSTGFYARYWGHVTVRNLRDGDHMQAWGVLQDGGLLLNPTYAVRDVDIQYAYTDSQDFILTHNGNVLTLMVLSSDGQGPVTGIVHAIPGGPVQVTRCGGGAGNWADLTSGKTINVTDSLLNYRLHIFLRTVNVQVHCP